jgi:hypothetical protein
VFTKVVRQDPDRLPARVAEAAAGAGLGEYEVTWVPQFVWKVLVGLLVAVCLAGMTAALVGVAARISIEYALRENGLALIAIVPTAVLAWLLLDPRQLRQRVFGFAGGLVFRSRKGELGAVGWDGIASARRATLRRGISSGPINVFAVELPDGESWSVSDRSYPRECLDAISRRVERELTARRLPEAMARIADGGQVLCGGAVVDATGATSSTLTVRWSEVRRVVDDFGTVRVLTPRGWRNLYEGWERSTPDVYLLVALTRRLAEG